MPTITPSWEAQQTDGNLNGASVGSSYTNGAFVDMTGHDVCWCSVKADFPATPTDDLQVDVFASVDGGSSYADQPLISFVIDNGTDPNTVQFEVRDVPGFRVSVKATGSTDSITVTHTYRRRRWLSN